MNSSVELQKDQILPILNQDRIWSAYALVDLEPEHDAFSHWYISGNSVLLCYTGLEPPILFAHGEVAELRSLIEKVQPGEYQISFPQDLIECLPHHVSIIQQIPMWRMRFKRNPSAQGTRVEVHPLDVIDLPHIDRLFKDQHDAPDGYHSRQLELGPFVGVWESGTLVATAGTHVFSERCSVAAIGNVFTHPDWRRRGYAEASTAELLSILRSKGITTIILNVRGENHAAVALYEKMGFRIHCPFYEGNILIKGKE